MELKKLSNKATDIIEKAVPVQKIVEIREMFPDSFAIKADIEKYEHYLLQIEAKFL